MESSHVAWHLINFTPLIQLTDILLLSVSVYSSLFVHLNSIARPSLNTMKLLAYYIKTTQFWEGFFMWSIKEVKSSNFFSNIPPVRALVEWV